MEEIFEEKTVNNNEETKSETVVETAETAETASSEKEITRLEGELKKKQTEYDELYDKYLRITAEYDNFRKRSVKEKEGVYTESMFDVLTVLLPVIDNLERASAFSEPEKVFEGLKMITNQLNDCLTKLGVEEIRALNEKFNPEVHNAVLHEQDEEQDENIVTEVLQKGYIKGDRVLRPSMVKVVN